MSTIDLTPTITADMAAQQLMRSPQLPHYVQQFEALLTKVKIGAVQSVVVRGFEVSVQDIFEFPG